MKVAVVRETRPFERRVALTPDVIPRLLKAGLVVYVEPGAGQPAGFDDDAYVAAGAKAAADEAHTVVFLKRSMHPGFAGIENEHLHDPKTTLLFGDAKDKLAAAVKAN